MSWNITSATKAGLTGLLVTAMAAIAGISIVLSAPRAGLSAQTADAVPLANRQVVTEPQLPLPDATVLGTGLSQEDAVAAAREFLPVSDHAAPVWTSRPGLFSDVFAELSHRPAYLQQPELDDSAAGRAVWGVVFKVRGEICGPSGADSCETRDALRTVFIDSKTGEWIRTTTFAPSPNEPLPAP